jgi:hypothetical protein
MKVKALTGVIANGQPIAAGDIFDGEERECYLLLASGRCELVPEPVELQPEERVEIGHGKEKESVKTEYDSPAGNKVGVRKKKPAPKKKGG